MIAFLAWLINRLIDAYILVIIVWCLLTWFPGAMQSRLGELINRIVQPYMRFFDEHIPPLGGISFAPVVAVIVLYLVQYGITMLTSLINF